MAEGVGTERWWDPVQKEWRTRKTGQDVGAVESAQREESRRTGLAAIASKTPTGKGPMPQQGDYGSIGEWSAAVRKWREEGESSPATKAYKDMAAK